jgi:hypothetical protein
MRIIGVARIAVFLLLCVALLGLTSVSAAPAVPRASAAPGWWLPWSAPTLAVPGPLYAVATAAGDDAWAVGADGEVYHFNGQAWSAVSSTVTAALHSVYPVGANTALVVGAAAVSNRPAVLACTPAGCARDNNVPAVGLLDSVWAVSPADYWAVGGGGAPGSEFGTILHYTGVWSPNLATGAAAAVHLHNIQMLSAAEGWAVGESATAGGPGTVFHYTSGAGWQAVDTGIAFSGALHSLWFVSPAEGWAVGGTLSADPVILHYRAGAAPQWTREPVASLGAPETLLSYVDMRPDGAGYAVGNNGQILSRDPATGTWRSVFTDPRPPQAPFYGVWLAPDGASGWAVGGVEGRAPDAGIFARFSSAVTWLPLVTR